MSYCRFQNTVTDLRDCHEALIELADGCDCDGDDVRPISEEEQYAAINLVKTCADILSTLLPKLNDLKHEEACAAEDFLTHVLTHSAEVIEALNKKEG